MIHCVRKLCLSDPLYMSGWTIKMCVPVIWDTEIFSGNSGQREYNSPKHIQYEEVTIALSWCW
jgi:hypothetical protein